MQERRKLPRYVLGSSGKLTSAGTHAETVTVLVLSLAGAMISCTNPPPVGERCSLIIEFEGREVEVSVEVRSREKSGNTGLKFLEVDEPTRESLKKICTGRPLAPASRPQVGR